MAVTFSDKDGNIRTIHSPIRIAEPGQKLLLVTTGGQQGGSTTVIPQSKGGDTLPTETVTQQQTLSSSYIKPKRTGSLGMFFRKVKSVPQRHIKRGNHRKDKNIPYS